MIKILLVEDDDTIAFGIRSALKRTGFEVMSCMSMTEGRKMFSEDISLVLLDLNLPDGSGYEFCRWVKERRDTPIIFLTVLDDVADITKGLDMGADDYITKPFSIPVLESRIRAVIRRISKTEEDILSCSTIQIDEELYGGVTNIGRKPTIKTEGGISPVGVETFVFDYAGDLYGKEIEVGLLHYIRPERKMSGMEELKEQISRDKDFAREFLESSHGWIK